MNNNTIKTELLSLNDVYSKNIGFIIPSYQRPYVWSEEDVVKIFMDIKAACDGREEHYFIGSSLSAIRSSDNRLVYELIDGQQRITTLMLISIAFKKNEVGTDLAKVSILADQPRLTFDIRDSVTNLLGSNSGLDKMTKPGDDTIEKDPYLKHLNTNLEVLIQKIGSLARDINYDVINISNYIYNNVKWVNNIVPNELDLNRLFSSMNTAGIQLEPVDLLKAKLLQKITIDKRLYNKIWQACEQTSNYFERNLRQLFPNADWNAIKFDDLCELSDNFFSENTITESDNKKTKKTIHDLFEDVNTGETPESTKEAKTKDDSDEIEDETVYCRSIIGFELLLIHALRIFHAQKAWDDLTPRIKSTNLMNCFNELLTKEETVIKEFFSLLWQVRFQFDKWIVKWVEHDDSEDPMLRLTKDSKSNSNGKSYINRTAIDLNDLSQLQSVLNFTGDRSAHYWLTAFLSELVKNPKLLQNDVLVRLEKIDNQLSITTETQKEASFCIAKGGTPILNNWETISNYFYEARGTGFEHYWFQKLEYLLWKFFKVDQGNSDEKLKKYRITSKNSVEHVYPQNEEYGNKLPKDLLDAFGNLVLLSPGENSSYSNQTILKKKADFDSKPRYDSLKLKALFDVYKKNGEKWGEKEIKEHQYEILNIFSEHYNKK